MMYAYREQMLIIIHEYNLPSLEWNWNTGYERIPYKLKFTYIMHAVYAQTKAEQSEREVNLLLKMGCV